MLVAFVSMMHLIWGFLLLINGHSVPITATSVIAYLVPNYEYRAYLYIISALLPVVLLLKPGSIVGLLSVLPQQILLITSGISSIVAITSGHFADGVTRDWHFIAMDQSMWLVIALFYTFESLDRYHERKA